MIEEKKKEEDKSGIGALYDFLGNHNEKEKSVKDKEAKEAKEDKEDKEDKKESQDSVKEEILGSKQKTNKKSRTIEEKKNDRK